MAFLPHPLYITVFMWYNLGENSWGRLLMYVYGVLILVLYAGFCYKAKSCIISRLWDLDLKVIRCEGRLSMR